VVEENPGGAEKNDGPAGRKSFIPIYPDTLPTAPKPPRARRTASFDFSDLQVSQSAITRFAKSFVAVLWTCVYDADVKTSKRNFGFWNHRPP
jgi:hypothetical protein